MTTVEWTLYNVALAGENGARLAAPAFAAGKQEVLSLREAQGQDDNEWG